MNVGSCAVLDPYLFTRYERGPPPTRSGCECEVRLDPLT
jgi:hypothetical protein